MAVNNNDSTISPIIESSHKLKDKEFFEKSIGFVKEGGSSSMSISKVPGAVNSETPISLKSTVVGAESPKTVKRAVFMEMKSQCFTKDANLEGNELPNNSKSSNFVIKLAESNQTPKLTPRNTQNLSQLKVARELKVEKPPSHHPSPSTPRSSRSITGNGDKREERSLLSHSQKIVIKPIGKSEGKSQVKVTVGSTSSDSSDGKRTPPRKRAMSSGRKRHEISAWKTNADKGVKMSPSLKSLKGPVESGKMRYNASWASFTFVDPHSSRPLSDVVSVRSLASIGMGSTDGRKLTIRRVPTSPTELLNLADPKALIDDEDLSSCSSYSGTLSECGTHYHPRRDHWSNKLQFILACVGYSVGIGNLWRFPYLCYKSGGGVFLIPYFIVLVLCGIPLLYMELAMGQFTRRGPIGALSQLCPIFKGAGLSGVMVSFFMSTYYNVIIAYFLYYFFSAFRSNAPWSECGNKWNSPYCWQPSLNTTRPNFSQSPSEEFYDHKVLQMTSGIDKPGSVRWELAACLFLTWVIVYFALWKSVRSSGRVLYFTTTLPFILVLAFLGRSLSLEGADYGLQYFFTPNWILLLDAKVWVNAVAQNFNSIGISFGSVISFASYNRYSNQILVDTIVVSSLNAVTSIIVGIFAFATIGNIAREHGTNIENVVKDVCNRGSGGDIATRWFPQLDQAPQPIHQKVRLKTKKKWIFSETSVHTNDLTSMLTCPQL